MPQLHVAGGDSRRMAKGWLMAGGCEVAQPSAGARAARAIRGGALGPHRLLLSASTPR